MKNKTTVLYILFGLITSLINFTLFYILCNLKIEYKIANLITLIVVKLIAYLLNKYYVFKSKTKNLIELVKEFIRFISARFMTFIIDYFGLIFLIDIINIPKLFSKILIIIIVIIINYYMSIKFVFKRKD